MFVHVHFAFFYLLQETVGWDLPHLWSQMGTPAKAVVIILFIMSAYSIGVMIDRLLAYSAARKQSRQFAPAVAGALREGKLEEAVKIADRYKRATWLRLWSPVCRNSRRIRSAPKSRVRRSKLPSALWTVPRPSFTPN